MSKAREEEDDSGIPASWTMSPPSPPHAGRKGWMWADRLPLNCCTAPHASPGLVPPGSGRSAALPGQLPWEQRLPGTEEGWEQDGELRKGMLAPGRAARCRLGWSQGEMYFVPQHSHPSPAPEGVCSTLPPLFPWGFWCSAHPPHSSHCSAHVPAPVSKKPQCSTGICIHQTSVCALQPSNTDPALPSWLGSEVNLPLP